MVDYDWRNIYITPCIDHLYTDEQTKVVLGSLKDEDCPILISTTPKTTEGNMWMKKFFKEDNDG